MTQPGSMPGHGSEDYGAFAENPAEGRERGSRRKKLAGYLKAANELRQTYQQSYAEQWGSKNGGSDMNDAMGGIPGAFPDVEIVRNGDEEMILFPSYCKRHVPQISEPASPAHNDGDDRGTHDEDYWKRQWDKHQDDKAIVDVDVRGWIYSPHRGPLNRKNRLLIGLARQLSGVPAPKADPSRSVSPDSSHPLRAKHEEHQARKFEEKIAREAEQILRKGKSEEETAERGGYSEKPQDDSDSDSVYSDALSRSRSRTPRLEDPPGPGRLSKKASFAHPSEMSPADLLTANTNLLARLKPFLTNPLVTSPVTIFFYNEEKSESRTVMTNDAGHFSIRAPLDFLPTHVRVLASEKLSATEAVKIIEPKGISVISDVDDTIKHTSIGAGAREIFRNAFIRDLADLTIEGVKEWYNTMYDMGAPFHYVSNSPWQLFPVLVSYFRLAGLPPGSYHLKQYSGMLQGIFEPVAERKKGTLQKIMRDFPERKFILIGDSGEADLEVYTDVVLANPGRIVGVFIRDVTTPRDPGGFFDSSMGPLSGEDQPPSPRKSRFLPSRGSSPDSRKSSRTDSPERRPPLPARILSEASPQTSSGPAMGTLIDFSEEPEEMTVHESHRRVMPRSSSASRVPQIPPRRSSLTEQERPKAPPVRPAKPLALRGAPQTDSVPAKAMPPPPPKPRQPGLNRSDTSPFNHPLSQTQNASDLSARTEKEKETSYVASARAKLSSAYNSLPAASSYLPGSSSANPNAAPNTTPRPPARATTKAKSESTLNASDMGNTATQEQLPPLVPPRRLDQRSIVKRLSWSNYRSSSTDTEDDESFIFGSGLTPSSSNDNNGTYVGYSGGMTPGTFSSSTTVNTTTNAGAPQAPVNKKVELWKRRWRRAKEILDAQGVELRSWRKGDDARADALRLVERTIREVGATPGIKGGEMKVEDVRKSQR